MSRLHATLEPLEAWRRTWCWGVGLPWFGTGGRHAPPISGGAVAAKRAAEQYSHPRRPRADSTCPQRTGPLMGLSLPVSVSDSSHLSFDGPSSASKGRTRDNARYIHTVDDARYVMYIYVYTHTYIHTYIDKNTVDDARSRLNTEHPRHRSSAHSPQPSHLG
jgi:hypothetical protein